MPPHFRVAHVAGIALRQRQDRAGFAEGAVGIFRRQALPGGPAAVCKLDVAGVAQSQRPVVIHRAAGVAAVAVILFVRHQRNRFMPPVQQIGRAPVRPALEGVIAGERIPLIEQVVAPGKFDKAVGVVHQPGDRRMVPAGIVAIGQRTRLALHYGLQNRRQA